MGLWRAFAFLFFSFGRVVGHAALAYGEKGWENKKGSLKIYYQRKLGEAWNM